MSLALVFGAQKAEQLPGAVLAHALGRQHLHALPYGGPAHFEVDPIQKQVGRFAYIILLTPGASRGLFLTGASIPAPSLELHRRSVGNKLSLVTRDVPLFENPVAPECFWAV